MDSCASSFRPGLYLIGLALLLGISGYLEYLWRDRDVAYITWLWALLVACGAIAFNPLLGKAGAVVGILLFLIGLRCLRRCRTPPSK
jgi:hypothetical protein